MKPIVSTTSVSPFSYQPIECPHHCGSGSSGCLLFNPDDAIERTELVEDVDASGV